MKARRTCWWVTALALLALARVATAEKTHVSSADDLCPPWENPCVISEIVTVDPPGDLDFGVRDVQVAQGGRLRLERANILCGSFRVDGPELRTAIVILDTDAIGSLIVTARRGCSLSPATPCLDDAACASSGSGTCSVGEGTIEIGAEIEGVRHEGPDVDLRAAGDIVLGSDIMLRGTGPEGAAGDLSVESFSGDVLMAGPITLRPAEPRVDYYHGSPSGYPGEVVVDAKRDVDVSEPIDVSGADWGGAMTFNAGRDLKIRNNLSRSALPGEGIGPGGPAHMYAGRDMIVAPHGHADDVTWITANGSSRRYVYGDEYYSYSFWDADFGGDTWIGVGGQFIVEHKAGFQSDTGRGDCGEGLPWGGYFYIHTAKGFLVDGPITGRASGLCGKGGKALFYSGGDGAIGPHGDIDMSATRGGRVLFEGYGNLDILGTVDTRGDTWTEWSYDGYPYFHGNGGYADLYGDDVTVSGDILLGGAEYGSDFSVEACRLRVTSKGFIDNRCLKAGNCENDSWHSNTFDVGQSMIAEPGSRILADSDAPMEVYYGSASQTPVLSGTFTPPPTLRRGRWPNHRRCVPCGDGEIEGDETCDDWNVTDGDGCNRQCVNEHCIAETPGYPATSLCDDGSSCTNDRCDPLASVCLHEPACADDLECTQEACVDGACVTTAVDSLCDDLDPCTSDLCNSLTGCINAALVGTTCDDYDICTQASLCQDGAGCVAPDPRPALGGRMIINVRTTDRSDVLVAKLDVPAAEVIAPLTESGVGVRLVDDSGNVLVDTYLPGALFSGHAPPWFDYRFDDPARSVAQADGVTMLRVRRKSAEKAAVQIRIKRPDLDDAMSARAFDLSVVFGADPDVGGCATLALDSCRVGKKIACRG